ncbi:MAG: helix-turn-helix domain-containing protein [Halobacteriota archaeon]
MKDNDTKQQFIALRAKDKSYKAISRELNVSKTTLLKWGSEFQEEIENRKAIELEALKEQYWLTVHAQVAFYGKERLRILEELSRRDLSEVPTPKLYNLLAKMETQLEAVCPEAAISDEDTLSAQKAFRHLVSPSGNGNSIASPHNAAGGMGSLRAEDLNDFLRNTLRRFETGELAARDVQTILAVIKTLFKGVEFVELQQRLKHIEELVQHAGSVYD